MAQPTSRTELINYCKRQLGAPVLEINVADEQVDDLVDDALQFFNERHFDGVAQTFLKYKITQDDIDRGRGRGGNNPIGIVTTTATAPASSGIATTAVTFSYEENSNYLQIPPSIIGITKIFHFDGSNTVTNNMFSVKYQLFLNDIYYWGSTELLTYAMVKTYLEDIDFLLTTQKQIRFNQRQDRLYLDIDWSSVSVGDYFVIECHRLMDPNDYSRVWNDSFLKKYLTSLIKRQWGQNLIKFQGVKLPGGIELNGRQIYDDAQKEIDVIMEKMSNTYELPPLDMIG
jgi:hypothetical protein